MPQGQVQNEDNHEMKTGYSAKRIEFIIDTIFCHLQDIDSIRRINIHTLSDIRQYISDNNADGEYDSDIEHLNKLMTPQLFHHNIDIDEYDEIDFIDYVSVLNINDYHCDIEDNEDSEFEHYIEAFKILIDNDDKVDKYHINRDFVESIQDNDNRKACIKFFHSLLYVTQVRFTEIAENYFIYDDVEDIDARNLIDVYLKVDEAFDTVCELVEEYNIDI